MNEITMLLVSATSISLYQSTSDHPLATIVISSILGVSFEGSKRTWLGSDKID